MPSETFDSSAGGLDHLYVAEHSRLLYIRIPKAACTTLLWGLLEWEGNDPSIMHRSLEPLLSTPAEVIHDMSIYPVPTLGHVGTSLRDRALTDPEWLRFAVVRNPYARLYSAWESKLLVKPPGNRRFKAVPDLIETERGIDVGASFRVFVRALSENPDRWMSERHFQRQADLVPIGAMANIELISTTEIADLFLRLSDRVGVPVSPRRSNEGLGIDGTLLLDEEAAERIHSLYASDFELTGADPETFSLGEPVYLDPVAQRLLRLAAARSQRTVQLASSYRQASQQSGRKQRRAVGWKAPR